MTVVIQSCFILSMVSGASTPLHDYATKGDIKGARQVLFSMGGSAFLKERDDEGDIPLHHAARVGNVEMVRLFLTYFNDPGTKTPPQDDETTRALNRRGDSPLHLAVARKHGVIARLLVDYGADTNGVGFSWAKFTSSRRLSL